MKKEKEVSSVYLNKYLLNKAKEFNINLSKKLNEQLRKELTSFDYIEDQKEVIESKIDNIEKEKKLLEKKLNKLYEKKEKISEMFDYKNKFIYEIRSNEEFQKEFENKLSLIKQAEDKETAIEKNVDLLLENQDLPFSKDELKNFVKKYLDLEDEINSLPNSNLSN